MGGMIAECGAGDRIGPCCAEPFDAVALSPEWSNGAASMGKIEALEYHRRARQCMRIASAVHDVAHKAIILDMGREWMVLAERAEKEQATPSATLALSTRRAEPTGPEHAAIPGFDRKMMN
jgi:hypothetical protein